MNIKKGNSLQESAKAVRTESKFSKKTFIDSNILLLEGSDDLNVIRNFYLYNEKKLKFRLVKASDVNFEESNTVGGKKNALNHFEKMTSAGQNVICLLDRDYDFFLEEKYSNSKVKYYDYYELENYLFEDVLLKIVFKNVCNYSDSCHYEELILLLHEIENACKPYILLCFLREVNYRKNLLNEDQIKKVIEILNVKITSMMSMNNLGTEDKLQRIQKFIEINLKKVQLDISIVKILLETNDYEINFLISKNEPLYLFRYALKGKLIVSALDYFFKYILNCNSHLNELKSSGNLENLSNRLKIEWLPSLSVELSELLQNIESEFDSIS